MNKRSFDATDPITMSNYQGGRMDFQDYQHEAAKTAIYPGRDDVEGLMYAALGLAGEAGEVANQAKKVWRDGNCRGAEIRKELGDVLWYIAQVASEEEIDLEQVAQDNIAKLRDRATRGVLGGSGDNR